MNDNAATVIKSGEYILVQRQMFFEDENPFTNGNTLKVKDSFVSPNKKSEKLSSSPLNTRGNSPIPEQGVPPEVLTLTREPTKFIFIPLLNDYQAHYPDYKVFEISLAPTPHRPPTAEAPPPVVDEPAPPAQAPRQRRVSATTKQRKVSRIEFKSVVQEVRRLSKGNLKTSA